MGHSNRLNYIDGIKAIAAIMVIFCHLSCVFLPEYYGMYSNKGTLIQQVFKGSPLNAITSGVTAVQCFFVLSGFLIARKVYEKKEAGITSPLKVYTNLLKVVLPSVLFMALLMFCGLLFHYEALKLDCRLEFVNGYNSFKPSLRSILTDSFYWTFIEKSNYVGPLWTIHLEFAGSVLIYFISYYAAKQNAFLSKITYFAVLILFRHLLDKKLIAFVLGALVYDVIYRYTDNSTRITVIKKILNNLPVRILVFCIGFFMACTNPKLYGAYRFFEKFKISSVLGGVNVIISVGVAICLLCVCNSSFAKRALSFKPLASIGSVSAYIYAFHWQIILSVGCGLFVLVYKSLPYWAVLLIIAIATFISTFTLSHGYFKIVKLLSNKTKSLFKKTNN